MLSTIPIPVTSSARACVEPCPAAELGEMLYWGYLLLCDTGASDDALDMDDLFWELAVYDLDAAAAPIPPSQN